MRIRSELGLRSKIIEDRRLWKNNCQHLTKLDESFDRSKSREKVFFATVDQLNKRN